MHLVQHRLSHESPTGHNRGKLPLGSHLDSPDLRGKSDVFVVLAVQRFLRIWATFPEESERVVEVGFVDTEAFDQNSAV